MLGLASKGLLSLMFPAAALTVLCLNIQGTECWNILAGNWLGCVVTAGAGLCRPEPNSRTHTLQVKLSITSHRPNLHLKGIITGEKHTPEEIFFTSYPFRACAYVRMHVCVLWSPPRSALLLSINLFQSVSGQDGWMDG